VQQKVFVRLEEERDVTGMRWEHGSGRDGCRGGRCMLVGRDLEGRR
jgi:hypothetical protein